MASYKGTGIVGRSKTPTAFKDSGVANARKNDTYKNTITGNVYECTKAGAPKVALWAYDHTAYIYRGTAVTGTDKTGKVFKRTDIRGAKVGNTYLNTNYGHVYTCTVAGDASSAKWAYQRTAVIAKPAAAVKGLATPKRTGYRYDAGWKVPDALTSDTSGTRASELRATWTLATKKYGNGSKLKGDGRLTQVLKPSATGAHVSINSFDDGTTTYTRQSFYPFKTASGAFRPLLTSLSVSVRPHNRKGAGTAKVPSQSVDFRVPPKPTISGVSFDKETGTLSCVITAAPDSGSAERYDTEWQHYVYDSRNDGTVLRNASGTFTGASRACTYDLADYQALADGYVLFRVRARSRGLAGPSDWEDVDYYLSFPRPASITGIDVRADDGRCVATINTNGNKEHRVRRVRLYRLADVPYARASDIPGTEEFTETDAIDDGQSTALSTDVAPLIPSAGNHTWLMVRSWCIDDTILHTDSVPMRVIALETKPVTAASDKVAVSAVSGADGSSAVVTLGWRNDNSTHTQITWSTDPNAWQSTKEPSSYDVERDDGSVTIGGTTYAHGATVYVPELGEGETWHVRARRVRDADDGTTYGSWSDDRIVIPSLAPDSVAVMAPPSIPTGTDLTLSWTFGGGGTQKSWRVTSGTTVLARGSGTAGSATIPWSRLAPKVSGGSVSVAVAVSTGGGSATSDAVAVLVAEPPTLSVTAADVTAQPLTLSATSGAPCRLAVTVTALGTDGQTPAGVVAQPAGDVPWAGTLLPDWTAGGSGYAATVALPAGLDLRDGARYRVAVTATDTASGLSSPTATADVAVAWAHQAPTPDATCCALEPLDYVDGEGTHHQSVTITLSPKASTEVSATGDVVTLSDADAVALRGVAVDGDTTQDGEPTASDPVALVGVEPTAIVVTATDGTAQTVALPAGILLDRLPDGTADSMAVASDGTVTVTKRTARTTTAATQGIGGDVGYDVMSSTGEIADGATVLYGLDTPTEATAGTVTMPTASEGATVAVTGAGALTAAWMTVPTAQTDVWDVYRLTGDGAALIGAGLPLSCSVTDEYAPLGDGVALAYRVASRTADGDEAWADFGYDLGGRALRIDWEGGSVELPYDIGIGDSYAKDVEVRTHMDGGTDAYWGAGTARTAKLSTSVMRLEDQQTAALVRQLAHFAGPAFVRTPDGSAYEADVQVSDMSTTGAVYAVAIDCTEVRLTAAYVLPPVRVEVGP